MIQDEQGKVSLCCPWMGIHCQVKSLWALMEEAPKADPLTRHKYAVVAVEKPTAGIRQVNIIHVYCTSRRYRNCFWPDAKHARWIQAPCWGCWCLETTACRAVSISTGMQLGSALPSGEDKTSARDSGAVLPSEYSQALPLSIMQA